MCIRDSSTVEPFPAERTASGITAPPLVSFLPALNVVLFFDRPANSPRTSPLSAFNQGIALCQALFFFSPLSALDYAFADSRYAFRQYLNDLIMLPDTWPKLHRRPSTVDENRMTGYQRSSRRSQEDDRARDVHWLADAMQAGDLLDHAGAKFRVRERLFGPRRGDKRGRHGIYSDVVLAPLDRETLGEVRNAGFGHAVYRLRR